MADARSNADRRMKVYFDDLSPLESEWGKACMESCDQSDEEALVKMAAHVLLKAFPESYPLVNTVTGKIVG